MFTADNRKILHEQEVEKMLILLLGHEDPNVQVAAAQALGVMAENLVSRDAIGQWGTSAQMTFVSFDIIGLKELPVSFSLTQ